MRLINTHPNMVADRHMHPCVDGTRLSLTRRDPSCSRIAPTKATYYRAMCRGSVQTGRTHCHRCAKHAENVIYRRVNVRANQHTRENQAHDRN